jgi:hypothetical protein
MSNFTNTAGSSSSNGADCEDAEDTEEIKAAKKNSPEPEEFSWSEKDVMLYNLGIGAKADDLKWVYENADGFSVSSSLATLVILSSSVTVAAAHLWSHTSTPRNSYMASNTFVFSLQELQFLPLLPYSIKLN